MMSKEKKFVPVMLTPFHEDGSIDIKGLSILTEYYLQNGAKGLFANCQSSEMFELMPSERLQIIDQVVQVVAGRVPVVAAGNFGNTIIEQAVFVKKVYSLGVQAVILLTNQLVKAGETEHILEQNIMELLQLTPDVPVGFYECPVPYKIIISPELLGRLVKTGRVIYHKDTCLDLKQVLLKNEFCKTEQQFGLYDAYMVHAIASLRGGSKGLSCIQGNYFPELVTWLCAHYNNDTMQEKVQLVQQFFIDEMEVMHKHYPMSAKYYLQSKGLPMSTYTRNTGNAIVSDEVKNEMSHLAERYRLLLETITNRVAEQLHN